ncbi:hypothetical protein Sked_12310 [Sanguibacter keddieii DSM 10542]|uniref:Lipoprotein n=1 Tax=Sanguibacter keddieii (strain ATCC 51767 / DSM 10542 / NCFB 3025 / ST-74) TaxID=446469 RepID=D1BE95_SANKS|nr:hypothetical protein [Sanguibacter keddieii]ACZ21173.1 hypothetical protein Sked_12310 [Sanguibacter keddieii DSM 10542]
MTARLSLRTCAVVAAAVVTLSACTSSAPSPETWTWDSVDDPTGPSEDTVTSPAGGPVDLTGTLRYQLGSVPPPYHYELTLDLTADEYTFSWSGYGDEVGRTTGTPLDHEGALEILDASGLLEGDDDTAGCGGGAQAQIDVEVDGKAVQTRGGTCGGEGAADDVEEAIVAVVGADTVAAAVQEVEESENAG